jgi:hypothetical protein
VILPSRDTVLKSDPGECPIPGCATLNLFVLEISPGISFATNCTKPQYGHERESELPVVSFFVLIVRESTLKEKEVSC